MVGKLPDADTARAALEAADVGKLVLSTMPTVGAVDTVVRLVEMFPPHLRAQTRSTLGRALRGIVSMRLLPRAGGRGRVPAVEVLVVNGLVAEALADSEGAGRLERLMADGDYYGMQTFDQSLLKLYERGLVDRATVLAHATYAPSLQVDIERIERTRANGSSGGTMFPPTAGPPPLASVTSIAPGPPPASRQFPPPPPAHAYPLTGIWARRGRVPADTMGRSWTFPPASSTSTNRVRPRASSVSGFAAAGHRAYLVGGTVRDAFLDRDLSGPDVDVDLTTDARPDAVERIVARLGRPRVARRASASGRSAARRRGRRFEITTFRAEVYRPESRKPEVAYSDDLETDLSRRDFTVNAMALAVPEPEFVDPFGGAADLAAKVLRTPLAPEVSFVDDPLRMLRAARFIAAHRARAGARARARGRDAAARASRSSARSGSATSCRGCCWSTTRRPGCGSSATTAPVGRVPPRAQRDAPRAGSDPHPQGRARAHDRRRAQDARRAAGAPRRAAPRHRQAEDPLLRDGRRQLPPPRGGRRRA